jgi:TetR/AcrR family transcriptional regulator
MADPALRADSKTAFLDAAERLLVDVGYAGITTRALAEEAGANHGLVHYYFGSMEELFVQVLERFTQRLIERQAAMYASDQPFLVKWREAMHYLEEDRVSGYQKVWLELQALAWNRPELRERVARVNEAWRKAMTDAVRDAVAVYELGSAKFSLEAWVALIVSFNEGIILERLSGITTGHNALLRGIEAWIASLDRAAAKKRTAAKRSRA